MKLFKKGFTVAELLVVVALGAILITLILVNIGRNRVQARDKVRVADIHSIRLALEEYRSVCGQYPQDIYGSTTKKSNGCPVGVSFDNFLPLMPVDPQSGDDYRYMGLQNLPGLSGTSAICFDYHLGADLEADGLAYFDMDHDADKDTKKCGGAVAQDFDGSDDASDGIYDFRSTNVHN